MVSVDIKHHVYYLIVHCVRLVSRGTSVRLTHSSCALKLYCALLGKSGVWKWGQREIIYLSRHCHHQNDPCFKMGSGESHFNVSLILRDKVTRQCPLTTTFEEKGEPNGIEPRSFRLPAYRLTARPNRLSTESRCVIGPENILFLRCVLPSFSPEILQAGAVKVLIIIIIIAVISIAPYFADKGERIALHKINKNVHIKTSKIMII